MVGTNWPAVPGTYALMMLAPAGLTLTVGSLGEHSLAAGLYVYVGSGRGPGGLAARLNRHLRHDKALHWHVDYLCSLLPVVCVVAAATSANQECAWAQRLLRLADATVPIRGFGSSDCRQGCPAHLVLLPGDYNMTAVETALLQAVRFARVPEETPA